MDQADVGAVVAAGGETWQIVVSAVLAAVLVSVDAARLRRR